MPRHGATAASTPVTKEEQEQPTSPQIVGKGKKYDIEIDRLEDEDRFSNNRDARPEERWHESLENLAKSYRDSAALQSELHDRAGYGARMKHYIFAFPAPIIAIIVACIASLWQEPDSVYLVAPLSAIGAIFSATHTILGLGGKAERYWSYAALYGGIVATVDSTLARDIDFRIPPDAFFARVRTEMGQLNANAPQLPGKGCCGCSKYEGKPILPKPTQTGQIHYEV